MELLERIKNLPTQPGVYIMKDSANRILYVGKAKNLRSRVKSYFLKDTGHSAKTVVLVKKIVDIEINVTNTELEALLLECNLIKKHRPRYNIRLKDDKNFPYAVIDFTHPFPLFRITRKIVISPNLKYFGPFSGGVREVGRFLLKTFQLRDCSDAKFKNRTRPCLNYEIGICTAPCVNYVTEQDYAKQVQQAILFLKGKKRELIKDLKKEMNSYSQKTEYEKAKSVRDKIFALEKLNEEQNAVLTDNLKDLDVLGSYSDGEHIQWVVLFIRGGLLVGRRTEKTPTAVVSEDDLTRTFLEQFYTSSLIPNEVWVMNDFADRETLQTYLSKIAEKPVKILVKRGEKALRLFGMAQENAKLLLQENEKAVSKSEHLKEVLSLPELPHTIEGIDVSNLQGTNPAVALVCFMDEKPNKNRYRIYYPKTVEGQDDFAMIYEIMRRRFEKKDPPWPDMIMIDGGIGQLSSAKRALDELKITIPICSLAKSRTVSSFTRKEITKSEERIFIPNRKNPIILREGSPALQLLQQVRDEAHRFSKKSHRVRRRIASGVKT
jgi:excinuclease ABC subunit C